MDPTGVVVAARTVNGSKRNKGSLPGWLTGGTASQPRIREDQRGPGQVAEGRVVPPKPGNAGGGKAPWFGSNDERGKSLRD
jgi:hypothetical protein